MKRLMVTLAVLNIAVLGTACLKIDTRHRLYLSPSGALAWSIQESDVHSDDVEASKRDEEEAQFVRAIEAGTHPPALALEQLGSGPAATRWIRAEPPFEVSTSARLGRADRLANAILKELGIAGEATLERAAGRTTLAVVVSDPLPETYEGPLMALVDEPASYQIVLTDGRFVEAVGFTISADGRVATPVERTGPGDGEWRLSLTWSGR